MSDVRYVHQHFDRPARFGWWTGFEWLLVGVAACMTLAWWRWISWLDFSGTASVAVFLNLPLYAYAQLRGDGHGRQARRRLRVLLRWHGAPRRGVPVPSRTTAAFAVTAPPADPSQSLDDVVEPPPFDRLWGTR